VNFSIFANNEIIGFYNGCNRIGVSFMPCNDETSANAVSNAKIGCEFPHQDSDHNDACFSTDIHSRMSGQNTFL
jgi:hypothetical protein